MSQSSCDLGIVGLGVMGRNLALNIADHGYGVAGLDRDSAAIERLRFEAADRFIGATDQSGAFVGMLRSPRVILLLVPAGAPVDAAISTFIPLISAGDLLIDGGNSHFRDTQRRAQAVSSHRMHFLGMGISGGAAGARHGPSLMPGGAPEVYERVRPILESIAAQVNGEPCVANVGRDGAGHYVKMVHNGIEYALMQLIAESYDLMARGLGLTPDELHDVYDDWNRGDLASFLLEITAKIFIQPDERTGGRLIDVIRDAASQKGTGKWTSQDSMDLQVPVPTIDAAVSMRELSSLDAERIIASATLGKPLLDIMGERQEIVDQVRSALFCGMMIAYAQGMALLRKASESYQFGLELHTIARIWRGGCIIRAAMLENIRAAYEARPDLPNLLLDPHIAQLVMARRDSLAAIVGHAADSGIAAPAFMASLAYLEGYRSARLPTNLIQAQRDYFGGHSFERVDASGAFHVAWK